MADPQGRGGGGGGGDGGDQRAAAVGTASAVTARKEALSSRAASASRVSRGRRARAIIAPAALAVLRLARAGARATRAFAARRPRHAALVVVVLALLALFALLAALVAVTRAVGGARALLVAGWDGPRLGPAAAGTPTVRSQQGADQLVVVSNSNGNSNGWGKGHQRYSDEEIASAALRVANDGLYGPVWLLQRTAPVVPNRTRVSIAYFVQIGEDAILLLPRLLAKIHHPDNTYILHVDSKVPEGKRAQVHALVDSAPHYQKNMHFLPSEMLTYKGVSMVLNTLSAITLARSVNQQWEYFINLSGTDYPLLSSDAQRQLLARPCMTSGLLNFISFFPKAEWEPYSFRVKFQFWDLAISGAEDPSSRLRRIQDNLENPLEPYRRYTFVKAEAWMILSRPFCNFLVRSAFAKRMLLNHVHVLSAPEHFFANVLYNHPFWRKTLVPDAFRKVVWYHQNRRSGQHPFILDAGDNPYAFWLYLEKTRSLFARKISKPSSPLVDRIDAELSGTAAIPADPAEAADRKIRQYQFYANMAKHFDSLTQKTLKIQNLQWPSYAYPPL